MAPISFAWPSGLWPIYKPLSYPDLKPEYEGQLLYPIQHLLHIVGVLGDNCNVLDMYKKN